MAAASLLAGISACSSSSKPEAASAATEAAEQSGAEAEVAADLTPVAAPENLVALSSLRAPAQSLDTVLGWTGLGLDWRALAQTGAASQLLPILDLDAPVDAVATLDPKSKNKPKVYFAAAVGLTSRQAALDAFRGMDMPVDPVEPGVYSVRPNENTLCFIAPALGKAKVRLVCSENAESLELLAPYLTRGNPAQAAGDAAFHLELRAEPAWRLYGDKVQLLELSIPMLMGEVSIGNAEFDAALRELLSSSVAEVSSLAAELNDLRLDLHLKENNPAELTMKLGVSLRGSTSWVASALSSAEGRAAAAPDVFWKLPQDATQASYQSKADPQSYEPALVLLERLAQSGLGQLGASAAVQKDWPQALHQLLTLMGSAVSAQGEVPERLLGASPDAREQLRARAGYVLLGLEDESKQLGAFLERTLKAYEDPALRKGLSQRYGVKTDKLPKVTSKKGPARLPESRVYELSLPASAMAKLYDADDDKSAIPSGNVPLVLITARDGARSWLAFSSYASLAEERLAGVLAPSGPEGTLERRAGLEPLRSERANVAGFWTVSALKQRLQRKKLDRTLRSLGESDTPMLFRANGHAQGPSGEIELHVPSQVFRELAAPYAAKP